mmetsp:Transcript_52354/g.154507  ORF Transcript_52354/g.154507 Transcript_52354/m.154507 type:complete len:318 (-) Transcript_52354:274-1227(-)
MEHTAPAPGSMPQKARRTVTYCSAERSDPIGRRDVPSSSPRSTPYSTSPSLAHSFAMSMRYGAIRATALSAFLRRGPSVATTRPFMLPIRVRIMRAARGSCAAIRAGRSWTACFVRASIDARSNWSHAVEIESCVSHGAFACMLFPVVIWVGGRASDVLKSDDAHFSRRPPRPSACRTTIDHAAPSHRRGCTDGDRVLPRTSVLHAHALDHASRPLQHSKRPAWIALMVTHTHERDVPSLQQSSPPPESSHTRRSNVRYRRPRAPASPSRGIARITEAHRATCTARHPRSWWTCLTCTPTATPHVANANETSSPHAE